MCPGHELIALRNHSDVRAYPQDARHLGERSRAP